MNPMSPLRRPRRSLLVPLAVAFAVVGAACSSGESALESGNDPAPTDAPSGSTSPPDASAPTGSTASGEPGAASTTAAPATTTTTPLSGLPACPVDALDDVDASAPVEITFWHSMGNELETALVALTDQYNSSQDKVRVVLENQTGYQQTIDKYVQSSQSSRPELVQFPEFVVQTIADSGTVIPIDACIEASGYDTSVFLDRVIDAWATSGVRWAMPFNVSNPVLYYLRPMFEAAGLDPDTDSPLSLEDLRAVSQAIVDSGAASFGIALDTGTDSGGGWFIEQWFAKAGELYADNGNGRLAPATQVLYDGPAGVELLTFVQQLIIDGLAVNVGDNPSGRDTFFKLADPASPAAMTIGTSAGLATVLAALGGGLIPGLTVDDVGVGPMPGPGGAPGVLVGGAALYIVADKGDAEAAAAWDYVQFLVGAESQSSWAAATGYVPVRSDAVELEPLATKYADDPRFAVAYEQLLASADDPASLGPVLGPQREVRDVTARAVAEIFNGGNVADALTRAADQSDLLIADYAARN
jgi:sn-glycerol 3-phosphate transport system substrate-binding protein